MLIDAHCHLDQLDDADGAIRAARSAGVGRIVTVAEDLRSMQTVLRLRDRHPETIVAGLGIHPQLIPSMTDDEVDQAFKFLEKHLAEADMLGEVGLDWKHARTEEEQLRQRLWLDRQLELARAARKPINLHSRRALRPVMEVAIDHQQRSGCPALLHWFTHSKKLIHRTNEAGVYVSAGPTILLNADTAAVAATVDPERLLTETDCPVPYGGVGARPRWIGTILGRLAAVRGVEAEELEAQIEENFARLLAPHHC